MKTLFDIEPIAPTRRPEKCNTCRHLTWLDYDSGKRFFYCQIRKSKRTQNGLLKVKASREACDGYKAG